MTGLAGPIPASRRRGSWSRRAEDRCASPLAEVGRSGDGGIDGIIKEDRLGLDTIYIQAKKWQDSVGRPGIQKFVGALQGQRAKKGVFISTSTYTAEALDFASRIATTVVLIDGQRSNGMPWDLVRTGSPRRLTDFPA